MSNPVVEAQNLHKISIKLLENLSVRLVSQIVADFNQGLSFTDILQFVWPHLLLFVIINEICLPACLPACLFVCLLICI